MKHKKAGEQTKNNYDKHHWVNNEDDAEEEHPVEDGGAAEQGWADDQGPMTRSSITPQTSDTQGEEGHTSIDNLFVSKLLYSWP